MDLPAMNCGGMVLKWSKLNSLLDWLTSHEEEGLVFHHPDGRLAKLRRKDFGIKW